MDSFWVFGYGSLMWNPGFIYEEAKLCRLYGYHRSFCIYSTHYRGTNEQPGLVLGLKKGGSCLGLGFKIAKENAKESYDYLIEREQVNGVYKEKYLNLYFDNNSHNNGLAFIADPLHQQYAENLDCNAIVDLIGKATGVAGKNIDYAINTVEHLKKMGIYDRQLIKITEKLTEKFV